MPHGGWDSSRKPEEVFEDHLHASFWSTVNEEVARNFAEDVVILTGRGVYHGHDGMRRLTEILRRELQECIFHYHTRLVVGDLAFLEWTATAKNARVDDGADSYVIRNGRIVAQTIHYTVKPLEYEAPLTIAFEREGRARGNDPSI